MGKSAHVSEPVQVSGEFCHDAKAAEFFAELVAGDVVYVNGIGWMQWTGKHWTVDDTGKVKLIAESIGDRFKDMISRYNQPDTAKRLMTQSRRCKSATGIQAMLSLAEPRCAAPLGQFDQGALKVNFQNCTLDFNRMSGDMPKFYEHYNGDYLTRIIPHAWNMEARCPRFEAFLEEIIPDSELREFLQRAIGYSLTASTVEQCFFLCYGEGSNGKSTLLNLLLRILGSGYATHSDARTFMNQDGANFGLARLRGARLLTVIETGDGKQLDEALVKAVTGGDPIIAQEKFGKLFEFTPQFKLWMATNHKPTVHDTSHAMWRRVYLIPFEETVPEERRNKNLDAILLTEAEGILRWAVDGLIDYVKNGLNPPDAVRAATDAYRAEEDVIGEFLSDNTLQEPNAEVAKGALYDRYKDWAGGRPMNSRRFGKRLIERGIDSYSNGRTRYWVGVRLLDGGTS